jgi:phosphoenolpyruvate carboxykinase (ATP)
MKLADGQYKLLLDAPNIGSSNIHHNLSVPELIEAAIRRGEGVLTSTGALAVNTSPFTGRSPQDKYIVTDAELKDHIDWGKVNQPLSPVQFNQLYSKALSYMSDKELFLFEGSAGADEEVELPIRIVTEYAWHNLFVRQLFRRSSMAAVRSNKQEFTVIALPGLKADPANDGTRSETFIAISFENRAVLIGGTSYAGEMKKSIFSVMNLLMPFRGVLPMHCSANVGGQGDTALFFGLSGTGKTTLSADPERRLIGDDEHGWSDSGVFNFEGGCYAKGIGLSKEKEPQIWEAIRYGAVLENVVIQKTARIADYQDSSITENTRAAFPVEYIPGAVLQGKAGHPRVIVFLTADAFGVLPPVSKLSQEQALYYFLSGYTSKLAGTERGITQPEATFSSCFGSPFLPLKPEVYAEQLGTMLDRHGCRVYLINTGWTGGAYGIGQRVSLTYTRAMVAEALNGNMESAAFTADPVFGLRYPDQVAGVPADILNPRLSWADKDAYDRAALDLAKRFEMNFQRFTTVSDKIKAAGPLPQ